jgi:tRNA threonylcarbamoyladenosine biosynthesis protein TsaE
MYIDINNESAMQNLGQSLGRLLHGGEVIELIGDVGAGKTTFVKGLALGLEIFDNIQSPSFTISRKYIGRNDIELAHYDFYRLNDAGIMRNEIRESISDPDAVTVVEWADIIDGILPKDKLLINISVTGENDRRITIESNGKISSRILEKLNDTAAEF